MKTCCRCNKVAEIRVTGVEDLLQRTSVNIHPNPNTGNFIIEIANSRNIFTSADLHAMEFAEKHKKILAVGADSHCKKEINNATVKMDPFNTPEEFLKSLSKATMHFHKSSPYFHIATIFAIMIHIIYINST